VDYSLQHLLECYLTGFQGISFLIGEDYTKMIHSPDALHISHGSAGIFNFQG
jgi:hypothetical protein